MTMANCDAIDPLVTPYLDSELPAADRALVDEHLRRCPPCRSRVDAERAARELVRTRKASFMVHAPDTLRIRCSALLQAAPASKSVGSATRTTRPPASWSARLMPFALAASLVLLVGGAFLYQATDRSARVLAAELTADHVKCFALDDVLGTHETPAAVEQAMLSGFGWHLNINEAAERAGLNLIGARRCLYTHGLVAHLMYRHQGQPVSVFMLPKESARVETLVEVLGHEAAIWSSGDRTFVLLARGSRDEVRRMATYVRAELR
jgi:anti-sigma factor RsiW